MKHKTFIVWTGITQQRLILWVQAKTLRKEAEQNFDNWTVFEDVISADLDICSR